MKKAFLLVAVMFTQLTVLFSQSDKNEKIQNILKEKFRLTQTNDYTDCLKFPKALKESAIEHKVTDNFSSSSEEGEPFILINPTDSNNIVLSYMEFGGNPALVFPVYYSLDGGQSWELSSFSTDSVFDADSTNMMIGGGGDPIFAFDSNGKLYFSWIYLGLNMTTFDGMFLVYWAWSNDKGASFLLESGDDHLMAKGDINLLSGNLGTLGDGIFDRPWFDVDRSGGPFDGSLYCSGLFIPNNVTPLSGNGMICKYKRAGNNTFAVFNAPVSPNDNVQFGNVRVDSLGNVHITYGDLDNDKIMHSMSADGGISFSTPVEIAAVSYDEMNTTPFVHGRENPVPSLAINKTNNSLHVVWSSFEGTMVKGYYSSSANFGVSWSNPIDISTFFADTIDQILMPTIAINEVGKITISGHSLDENDAGTYFTVQSVDGGSNFDEPFYVAGDSTYFQDYPASTNPLVPSAFFGDYETSDRYGCKTFSIWSDGRDNLGPKVYVAITDHCLPTIAIPELIPVTDKFKVKIVYPNPASTEVSVEILMKHESQITTQLLSISGEIICELSREIISSGNSELRMILPEYIAAGQYFLSIQSDYGRVVKSLVVK